MTVLTLAVMLCVIIWLLAPQKRGSTPPPPHKRPPPPPAPPPKVLYKNGVVVTDVLTHYILKRAQLMNDVKNMRNL